MSDPPPAASPPVARKLIAEFIDAVVEDRKKAQALISGCPELLRARYLHGGTVLHFLAVERYADAVRWLAEHGCDVDTPNDFGDSPLIDVATLGIVPVAEILLRHGANPNATSRSQDNVLHAAVRSGDARLVSLLLDSGADPRYVTDLDETIFDAVELSRGDRDELLSVLEKYGIAKFGPNGSAETEGQS